MARLILGLQPVREAVRVHGARLEKVMVERDPSPRLEAVARFATDRGATVTTVTRGDLDRLSGGVRHQGVAAFAPELLLHSLDRVEVGPATALVALDGVMDPQNFGAVIRSAVALGATGVLWAEHASAPLTPSTFRASAGAVEHAVLYRVRSMPGALEDLAARGVISIALDAAGDVTIDDLDLKQPICLVIGAEDKGARKSVRRACAFTARLPMTGAIASLNASVAGAVALYEVARQRRHGG